MSSNAARTFLLSHNYGTLSTLSVSHEGFPFGSITPYCLDREANLLIYVSDIAEHTKNMKQNPNVCITIREEGSDPQAGGRVSVLATSETVSDEHSIRRYFRFFPTVVCFCSRNHHC